MMTPVAVTSVFALCFSILIFYLVLQVVRCRRKYKVGYGDGKHEALSMAISAHSNAVETIPLALILMLLLELNKVSSSLIIVLGLLLLVLRIIHVAGMMSSLGSSFGRTYGTLGSWIIIILMAVLNLIVVAF